ncbi:unnamed protein product [Adineta steineri]|uniref:G-protein coupled receptors family 1 profile domain-containing protein n=1 Tax=Adineta steineri TaxID=433720 RepID=A0A818VQA0_9BILA|nr:unnamed protein product [Adineta steineri]
MSSSNATNLNEINTLNRISSQLTIWGDVVFFIFGISGNLLNIYVFTQRSLRRNPCAMYFLSSTTACSIFYFVSMPFRILQYGFNIDPTYYLLGFCKTEYYITFPTRALASWFLVLACIDRFLRSSPNITYRQWSSFKVASYTIPITILLVFIGYIHIPIFYTINGIPPICAGQPGFYRIFLGFWHVIIYGSGPPFLMFVFSVLTIRHVKHRRIAPSINQVNQGERTLYKEKGLLRMALVQCLCIGLTTTLFSISQLYVSITTVYAKSNLQLAKENLFLVLGGLISTGGHGSTFYLYTATSRMFRQHLFHGRHARL